jgi:mono/diheme cytochrome c family protein
MRLVGVLAILIVCLIGLAGIAIAYQWHGEIAVTQPPPAASFNPEMVQKGAQLASIGNCIVCHTREKGAALAGGAPLPTPFGTVYSTNITPEPETGIGRWSEAAFMRSLREGVDRRGRHLYPAFPYDHFTLVTDEDSRALYAYLMTREPVRAAQPANELTFPFNIRTLLAGWKLLYFTPGAFRADPNLDAELNRGKYLAEGLGHCGACHTPRNALGAEIKSRAYNGGAAEGWHAYAINANSPAPVAWNADTLYFYLRNGWEQAHGIARGPMVSVVTNLGVSPERDVQALAKYVDLLMSAGKSSPPQQENISAKNTEMPGGKPISGDSLHAPATAGNDRGAQIYQGACAACHDSGRSPPFGGLPLALSTGINSDNPQNVINVTLFGLPAADGEASPIMPGFDGVFSDEELVELLQYLRKTFTRKAEWPDLPARVASTRKDPASVAVIASPPITAAPVNAGEERATW